MSELYKLTLSTGENSTLFVILENPLIRNGFVEGTKVGEFHHIEPNGEMVFAGIEELHFMAGGCPWTLEEFKGDLI